jgi:hypothetical protein
MQIEALIGVSDLPIPICDLNHWRSASTNVIDAIGVPQIIEAMRVISSNATSRGVSRMLYDFNADKRRGSTSGGKPDARFCFNKSPRYLFKILTGPAARAQHEPGFGRLRLLSTFNNVTANDNQLH